MFKFLFFRWWHHFTSSVLEIVSLLLNILRYFENHLAGYDFLWEILIKGSDSLMRWEGGRGKVHWFFALFNSEELHSCWRNELALHVARQLRGWEAPVPLIFINDLLRVCSGHLEKLVSEGGREGVCPPTPLQNTTRAWQGAERLSLKKQAVAWFL